MQDKQRVLILQHIVENPPGRVGDILDEHKIPYDALHVGQDHLPDPATYDALIVLGGSQHVYDRHKYPYTIHEEIYLHNVIRQEMPCLGICLGGQLLANAFGAPVKRLPKEHIGFFQIHFTQAGQKDPLYEGLPGYQQAFQWHEDCFDLPIGAVPLAHHADGSNQAFRYGRHAYGLQYHVELTEAMLNVWLHDPSLKNEFTEAYGTELYERVEREFTQVYATYAQHSRTMIENFLKLSKLV